jgi:hypothetical protein
MVVACIGWGSLIWDPRDLAVRGGWFGDGPLLPVEFLRQSRDGRITLVLSETAEPVRTLWCLMSVCSLADAARSLRQREGIPDHCKQGVGCWPSEERRHAFSQAVESWAESLCIDAAVWTTLPPKFGKDRREPSSDEVVRHLQGLPEDRRRLAEQYVRRAPVQIDTAYRRAIEKQLGWRPLAVIMSCYNPP